MGVKIGSSDHPGIEPAEAHEPRAPSQPSAIELHIEELVLHGFQAADRRHIGDAVERELARLLTEQGVTGIASGPTHIDRIDGGEIRVAAGVRPHAIGAQLARNLHRGLASPAEAPHKPRVQEKQGPR